MCNSDWRQVYRDERHRPGYVIENGKPAIKLQSNESRRQPIVTSLVKTRQTMSPIAPTHPCSYPGCAVLIDSGDSRCNKHRIQMQREIDQLRGSAAARGYGSKWRKARQEFLRRNPLCAKCNQNGILKVATAVDHIIPHKGDVGLFWDQSNWQALCFSCHSRKTAKSDGRWG
jgi:5-methylcytosine-specific restriction enzyme A